MWRIGQLLHSWVPRCSSAVTNVVTANPEAGPNMQLSSSQHLLVLHLARQQLIAMEISVCWNVAGRADYFGQAVNRAARLREAAPPGQVRFANAAG